MFSPQYLEPLRENFRLRMRIADLALFHQANSVEKDQTAPERAVGAVWSGSKLFANPSVSFGQHTFMIKPNC